MILNVLRKLLRFNIRKNINTICLEPLGIVKMIFQIWKTDIRMDALRKLVIIDVTTSNSL